MDNTKEEPNIFSCLAKAWDNDNVEFNWAKGPHWYTFNEYWKTYNKRHSIQAMGPYLTRTRKKSIVDEVTEKLLDLVAGFEGDDDRDKIHVQYPELILDILQGYHIKEKSEMIPKDELNKVCEEQSDTTPEKIDNSVRLSGSNQIVRDEPKESTPECEHDSGCNLRKGMISPASISIRENIKCTCKPKEPKQSTLACKHKWVLNETYNYDECSKCGILQNDHGPELKQTKIDECAEELGKISQTYPPYRLFREILSKYITKPSKGIEDLIKALSNYHGFNIPDKHIKLITKHWPKQVDHEKVANTLWNHSLSEKEYANFLKESYGEA